MAQDGQRLRFLHVWERMLGGITSQQQAQFWYPDGNMIDGVPGRWHQFQGQVATIDAQALGKGNGWRDQTNIGEARPCLLALCQILPRFITLQTSARLFVGDNWRWIGGVRRGKDGVSPTMVVIGVRVDDQ